MSRSDPRRRARRGSVVVEAALLLPLLALTMVASIDVARYLQMAARADRVAGALADMVSRADTIRDRPAFDAQSQSTDTGVYFELARQLAAPEDLAGAGGVVIRSLTGQAGGPRINWSRGQGPAADLSPGGVAVLTTLPAGMNFVVAEIFLPFRPIILDRRALLGEVGFDRVIYRRAVYRPRAGALTTLAPA